MAIDDIVGDADRYTQEVVGALQPGQKYKFLIIPNVPPYQQPAVNPAKFPDKAEYRKFLITKHQEFFQTQTTKARELMDMLGIEYRCMGILSLFAADLTKDQYEALKKSTDIRHIEADHPIGLFNP